MKRIEISSSSRVKHLRVQGESQDIEVLIPFLDLKILTDQRYAHIPQRAVKLLCGSSQRTPAADIVTRYRSGLSTIERDCLTAGNRINLSGGIDPSLGAKTGITGQRIAHEVSRDF